MDLVRFKAALARHTTTLLLLVLLTIIFAFNIYLNSFTPPTNTSDTQPTANNPTATPTTIFTPTATPTPGDLQFSLYSLTPDQTTPTQIATLTLFHKYNLEYTYNRATNDFIYWNDQTVNQINLDTLQNQQLYQDDNALLPITLVSSSIDGYLLAKGEKYNFRQAQSLFVLTRPNNPLIYLGDHNPVLYGSWKYLGSVNQQHLVHNEGGDGCGGYGQISLLDGNQTQEIMETGHGCAPQPRYIGYDHERTEIIYANTQPEYNTLGSGDLLLSIDALNVTTQQSHTIYNVTQPTIVKDYRYDDTTKQVIILTNQQLITLNVRSLELNTYLLDSTDQWPQFIDLYHQTLVYQDYSSPTSTFTAVKWQTNSKQQYPPINNDYKFIGSQGDTLYFYKYEKNLAL